MNPYYELPKLGGGFRYGRTGRFDRRVDAISSIGAFQLVNGLETAVRLIAGRISRWRRRRASIRELQALSDHQLKDIGLDRHRIVSAVENITETVGVHKAPHRLGS